MDAEPFETTTPSPYRWWQIPVLLAAVALCDVTIYRGEGYAGYAALFAIAPLLFCLLRFQPRRLVTVFLTMLMLGMLAAKLLWWGGGLQIGIGFALLTALAMALSGMRPFPIETFVFSTMTVPDGYQAIARQWRSAKQFSPNVSRPGILAVGLPLLALTLFGFLFVMANPDLSAFLGDRVEHFAIEFRKWFDAFTPTAGEIGFWLLTFWILAGALRPSSDGAIAVEELVDEGERTHTPSDWYGPFRNMLWAVILLFAVYLVFEFQTLWFRDFPKGFYYSGYAHEGAFWLTVALGLTTLILSLVFRGSILKDDRRRSLRKLAWLWSVENLLLAGAVYHRMLIYVDFNGMTRMRVVGFCGISAVVVGFLLVLVKIAKEREFVWLIRRQLTALFCFVYLYAVAPVDELVMAYNTQRILAGDPAPYVQISVHPIDPDGYAQLIPLLNSDNTVIREGVRAMLAEEYVAAKKRERNRGDDWTTVQLADGILVEQLATLEKQLKFRDYKSRKAALSRFHKYAYQWY